MRPEGARWPSSDGLRWRVVAHLGDGGRPSWRPVIGVVLPPLWHQGHKGQSMPRTSRGGQLPRVPPEVLTYVLLRAANPARDPKPRTAAAPSRCTGTEPPPARTRRRLSDIRVGLHPCRAGAARRADPQQRDHKDLKQKLFWPPFSHTVSPRPARADADRPAPPGTAPGAPAQGAGRRRATGSPATAGPS